MFLTSLTGKPAGRRTNYSLGYWLIIIFINCNWVVTGWKWLFYMYTKYEIGFDIFPTLSGTVTYITV